ncbi:hypothetical protein GQ43DRAFT_142400 [Delitschia confertaspora ATCC 74209]|uniref:Uncharacterized protein n=1 Tax=Delitschia confertaspora ATCC 74209 TaxID=1513339 RepID=A0A9P4MQC6_9PLEO|nr:hypothetical protein GQ43DRAFT_142400 [Delitschia confertaspora ATCC 74209]
MRSLTVLSCSLEQTGYKNHLLLVYDNISSLGGLLNSQPLTRPDWQSSHTPSQIKKHPKQRNFLKTHLTYDLKGGYTCYFWFNRMEG